MVATRESEPRAQGLSGATHTPQPSQLNWWNGLRQVCILLVDEDVKVPLEKVIKGCNLYQIIISQ